MEHKRSLMSRNYSSTIEPSTVYPMAIINLFLFGGQCVVNTLGSSTQIFNKTIGEVADLNQTRLTPASYAFVIWSAIYALQLAFVLRFLFKARRRPVVEKLFALSTILNSAWIVAFAWEMTTLALGILAALWLVLSLMWVRLNVKSWAWLSSGEHIFLDYSTVFIPFSLYLGWTSAALVVNITVVLKSSFDSLSLLSLIVLLCILTIISIIIISIGVDLTFALAVCWALVAVFIRADDVQDWDVKRGSALAVAAIVGASVSSLINVCSQHCCWDRNHIERSFSINSPEFLAFARNP